MTRYEPAKHYRRFGLAAAALSLVTGWYGWGVAPLSFAASGLFACTALPLLLLSWWPALEIHEGFVLIGKRMLPWIDIRRVDRTRWISPLIVRVTLYDDTSFLVIYPGDLDCCNSLLRQLRRGSRDALIDGIPYRQYWGEVLPGSAERRQTPPPPRYRILRPEDEAEVERLYQRLKTVGHLDQKNSSSTDEG